jgi:hypothetical protein
MGPAGPTGVANLAGYGTFLSTTARTINADDYVIFDVAGGDVEELTFTAGGTQITIGESGRFAIDYSLRTATANGASMVLEYDGSDIANSTIVFNADVGQATGSVIAHMLSGKVLSVRIIDDPVTLSTGGTNAYIKIIQLDTD